MTLRNPLQLLSARLRRFRRGSVLLIVIVLLLLLSILGTAYLSTSRNDRVTSEQNAKAVQNDNVVDGIANMVAGLIVDDLNDQMGNLRGAMSASIVPPVGAMPWSSTITYHTNDLVCEPGIIPPVYYQYIFATPAAGILLSNTAYWNSIGGTPPAPFVPYCRPLYRGVYAAASTYNFGDMVSDLSNPPKFYMCAQYGITGAGNVPAVVAPYNTDIWVQTTHLGITSLSAEPWIAARIPSLPLPGTAVGAGNLPFWQNISQSSTNAIWDNAGFASPNYAVMSVLGHGAADAPVAPAPQALPAFAFESPDGTIVPPMTTPYQPFNNPLAAAGVPGQATPGVMTVGGVTGIPALAITGTTGGAAPTPVVAGDADGDGIADCLLFRIPGAYYDGLTWYAGVRIVDNNSAINVNTAWSQLGDFLTTDTVTTPTQANWGFFQSNTGLLELVNNADVAGGNFTGLMRYRFNDTNASPIAAQAAYDETGKTPPFTTANPPANRPDFQYLTMGDTLYHQFISRVENPGWNFDTTYGRFQALPEGDTAALAYHFCLTNPNSGQSLLESLLPNSLVKVGATSYRSSPYIGTAGNDATQWWSDNFNYDNLGINTPIRPLLVTSNPVSNYITPVYGGSSSATAEPIAPEMLPYGEVSNGVGLHYQGTWNSTKTYANNDIVSYQGFTFISPAASNTGNIPGTITNGGVTAVNANWRLQPWNSHPTKANINTATFAELYRAFWCVMAGNPADSCVWGVDPAAYSDPYAYSTAPTFNYHQFRSPLRDPTYTTVGNPEPNWMKPSAVMLLRAAIAAVNTLGMRDPLGNVISRTVTLSTNTGGNFGGVYLTGTPTPIPVQAMVYSAAPNPVISEVFVNNDNTDKNVKNADGYVAVELYNPNATAINIGNWQLAGINRTAATSNYPNLALTALAPIPAGTIIPAGGYVLFENYNASGGGTDANGRSQNVNDPGATGPTTMPSSGYPPTSYVSNTNDVYIANLASQFVMSGGELVILRPRRADGTYTSSTDPQNTFNEGTSAAPNLTEMVPVDSYDFTGMLPPGSPSNTYHYARVKGGTGAFKSIFPGRYDVTTGLRQNHTDSQQFATGGTPPPFTNPQTWGATTTTGSLVVGGNTLNNYPPIQISPTGMPGPNIQTAGPNKFPFGVFGRNGDMLDIPFIGAYRILSLGTTYGAWNMTTTYAQYAAVTYQDTTTFVTTTYYSKIAGNIGNQPSTGGVVDATQWSATPLSILELNSLPMDSSFADAGDVAVADDAHENIGRFCPVTSAQVTPAVDYYAWTRKLFDYLTVQSGSSINMPNVDASMNDVTTPADPNVAKYPATPGTPPTPVYSADGAATDQISQDNVGVQGLININTASWKVLSMLPMVTYHETGESAGSHPNATAANEALAKAIVVWRDGDGNHPAHGPFMSIFDLNSVYEQAAASTTVTVNTSTSLNNDFQNAYGWIALANQGTAPVNVTAAPPPNSAFPPYSGNGLLFPADAAFPNISTATPVYPSGAEDFQGDFAVLNRISNLITTRSDTFTVYIVVEGWQNAVTTPLAPGQPAPQPPPQLKITRRYAFIADRSAINADLTSRFLKTVVFPND
jgi:hypothetical protein